MVYSPKQKDIVWVDFDPSTGREITKRRPALVISNDEFNQKTGFCIVCPITSIHRGFKTYIPIQEPQEISGEIVAHQMKSIDYKKRNIGKIEQCDILTWIDVIQTLPMFF